MAVTAKHTFGWNLETTLKPIIEMLLQEELTKTEGRYDSIDFTSPNRYVELKGRRKYNDKNIEQTPDSFKTWVVPADKVEGYNKPVTILYYWDYDRTLWRCDYDKEVWDTFVCGEPMWTSQIHYFVPKSHWTKIYG